MIGYVEFEFDLPVALLNNLVKVFDEMDGARLSSENLISIPEAQGVYQLSYQGFLSYIGKTDAEAGLRKRLERHTKTIQHRHNLDPCQVTFKAVRVFVFTAMDIESQLIKYYGGAVPVPWNNSGFGSNDPGRQRDTTNLKPDGFDAQFPIDIDREISLDLPIQLTAATALTGLKDALPYTFRFENAVNRGRKPHPDLVSTEITLPQRPYTTRSFIEALTSQLPYGWQATLLPSRVILYKENHQYTHGKIIATS